MQLGCKQCQSGWKHLPQPSTGSSPGEQVLPVPLYLSKQMLNKHVTNVPLTNRSQKKTKKEKLQRR